MESSPRCIKKQAITILKFLYKNCIQPLNCVISIKETFHWKLDKRLNLCNITSMT